jgi:hypothetical protein
MLLVKLDSNKTCINTTGVLLHHSRDLFPANNLGLIWAFWLKMNLIAWLRGPNKMPSHSRDSHDNMSRTINHFPFSKH